MRSVIIIFMNLKFLSTVPFLAPIQLLILHIAIRVMLGVISIIQHYLSYFYRNNFNFRSSKCFSRLHNTIILSRTMTLNLPSLTSPSLHPPLFLGGTIHVLRPRSFLCLDRTFPSHGTSCFTSFLHRHGRYLSFRLFFLFIFFFFSKARRRNKLVLLRHPEVVMAACGGDGG